MTTTTIETCCHCGGDQYRIILDNTATGGVRARAMCERCGDLSPVIKAPEHKVQGG